MPLMTWATHVLQWELIDGSETARWSKPEKRSLLPRKEVIHPHVPVGIPCYDFTPIIDFTLDGWLPKVTPPALGTSDFRGVTGGVYKARERIHRSMLTCDY